MIGARQMIKATLTGLIAVLPQLGSAQSVVCAGKIINEGVTKAEVYWALGVIHVELGEAPKAKGMFQRGLELEPDNATLRDALARLA